MAMAGRAVADVALVGVGVGAAVEGVQEAATRARVNTRARYLKVT
jgi:hypothetical protein